MVLLTLCGEGAWCLWSGVVYVTTLTPAQLLQSLQLTSLTPLKPTRIILMHSPTHGIGKLRTARGFNFFFLFLILFK